MLNKFDVPAAKQVARIVNCNKSCSVRAAYVLTLTDGDAAGFVGRIDEDSRNEPHRVGVLLEISNTENKQNVNLQN